MKLLIFILSLFVFIKTLSYGIFELEQQKNKSGGISVILISTLVLILSNIIAITKGVNFL